MELAYGITEPDQYQEIHHQIGRIQHRHYADPVRWLKMESEIGMVQMADGI